MKNHIIRRRLLMIMIICFVFFVTSIVIPENQKKISYPQVKYDITVRLKLFDVLVLDDDDKPIKNLTKDDFELYIDGKPRKIDTFDIKDFTVHEMGKNKPIVEPEEISPEYEQASDMRLLFFVFHNLRIFKGPRKTLAEGIYDFIDNNLSNRDLVSIYYLQGSALINILPFTNEKELIKRCINDYIVEGGKKLNFQWPEDNIEEEVELHASLVKGGKDGSMLIHNAGFLGDFKVDDYKQIKIIENINLMTSLQLFIRSLYLFKGRKEVFIFSHSAPMTYYGSSKTFWDYKKLIQDAKNNNIVINTFDLRRANERFDLSIPQGIGLYSSSSIRIISSKSDLNEYLFGLSADTNGQYFSHCNRRDEISEKVKEVYDRSSYVYYLGTYINDLPLNEKYDVEVNVKRDDVDVIYHDTFRTITDYSGMDMVDRWIQILEALYGSLSFNNFNFRSEIVQFPYTDKNTLIITCLKPNTINSSSNDYDAAVRYYNIDTLNDSQQFQGWNISQASDKKKIKNISILMAAIMEDGDYNSRYVLRDSDTGDISNAKGKVKLGLKEKLLSSIVVFTENAETLLLTNLMAQDKSFDKNGKETLEYKFDPNLNPFIYSDKFLAPSLFDPIDRNKLVFMMFMYNTKSVADNKLKIEYSISPNDGNNTEREISLAAPVIDSPNGWRRVTLKLPLAQIPPDINELKFVVIVKDQAGKEIESESTYIKIK